eukprot:2394040-Amphidinium_carterae.1
MSPTSPREALIPASNGPRLPTRLSAQSLLRGQLYIPYTGYHGTDRQWTIYYSYTLSTACPIIR